MSSPEDKLFQWQAGAFFVNESSDEFEGFDPVDLSTHAVLSNLPIGNFYIPSHYREYAAFGNLDYHFSPLFDVSVGGRYSRNKMGGSATTTGLFGGGAVASSASSTTVTPGEYQGVFTYSADARWHVTAQSMLYARVASGYVPGGSSNPILKLPGYSSSTVMNYELGIKSSMFNGRFSAELSAFYIDWRKLQVSAVVNGFDTTVNEGNARSDGAEWNIVCIPLDGLTVSLNGSYTDAKLTSLVQQSGLLTDGNVGDRLPAVPEWQTAVGAEYRHHLARYLSGFGAIDWRYLGDRYGDFGATGIVTSSRVRMPSYNIVDIRTGVDSDHWTFALYVKNLGDKIAINYVQPELLADGSAAQAATVYTPRTIGASVTARF